jgi:hypothetical protein
LFSNLTPAANANDYYDLLLNGDKTVEVRTTTDKTQISFESSANVGAGRDGVNKQATMQKIANVDYWVSCNISRFPSIEITVFTGNQVKSFVAKQGKQRQQFSRSCINQILKEPK